MNKKDTQSLLYESGHLEILAKLSYSYNNLLQTSQKFWG